MFLYFLPISLYLAAVVIYIFEEKVIYNRFWGYYALFTTLAMVMVGVNLWGVWLIISNMQ